MKLLKVDDITGKEKLARAVMTSNYKELLSEGIRLKKEYIPKLKELGITNVYVNDNESDPVALAILKDEVNIKCKEKVQQIISREKEGSGKIDIEFYNHDDFERIIDKLLS